jgi:single-stranded DNA-specific DHH superfamily exonuclease
MEALYKQRPDLKTINRLGYRHLQEVSAIVSVFRFGNFDVVEQLNGLIYFKNSFPILMHIFESIAEEARVESR